MQPTPSGWPQPGPIETVPEVQLITDAGWPPSDGVTPSGTAAVETWRIIRELTGGGLPGAARGGSGFSVASGTVTIPQPDGAPMTPWAGYGLQVSPAGAARIEASDDDATIPLGSFLVDVASGADSEGVMSVDVIESQRRLDGPCNYVWTYDAEHPSMDAADVIRAIAASAGYDTSRIEDTGSRITGLFDVAGKSNREVIQDIARATLGAAWQDETGMLVYRNAASMRSGTAVETVIADHQLEDVAWSVSRDNAADRIEVTYTPATLALSPPGRITMWEASDPMYVNPGTAIHPVVDLTGTTDEFCAFLPIWDTVTAGDDGAQYSRWAASYAYDGGGERPPDDALRVSAKLISPSRARLTIVNTTDQVLHLVDGNGNPCLILRTKRQVQPGEPQTVSWGEPAETAVQPFDFDCGQWVQDTDTAQQILTWLVAQMDHPLATIDQVSVHPDLTRQLGDVIVLTEEQIDGHHQPIRSKALITGMTLSGDASGYTQEMSLALLAVTFADLDRWMQAHGIVYFDDLDAYLISQGVVSFNDLDRLIAQDAVTY